MERVLVTTSAAGVPLVLDIEGRRWQVGAEPIRWYERQAWWESARRMPRGSMARIDVEIWQVQARGPGKNRPEIHAKGAPARAVKFYGSKRRARQRV